MNHVDRLRQAYVDGELMADEVKEALDNLEVCKERYDTLVEEYKNYDKDKFVREVELQTAGSLKHWRSRMKGERLNKREGMVQEDAWRKINRKSKRCSAHNLKLHSDKIDEARKRLFVADRNVAMSNLEMRAAQREFDRRVK